MNAVLAAGLRSKEAATSESLRVAVLARWRDIVARSIYIAACLLPPWMRHEHEQEPDQDPEVRGSAILLVATVGSTHATVSSERCELSDS